MSFDGNGNFRRLFSWIVDAANNVNISSSRTDAEMNGFAAGLTNCITRDGQSPPSADLPMGGKKLVNLGAATVGSDALNRDTADARYWTLTSANILTFNNGGSGASSGTTFNGSAPITISYNSIGAVPAISPNNYNFNFTDANGGHPFIVCQTDNDFVFYATDGGGSPRAIWSIFCHSSTSSFVINPNVQLTNNLTVAGSVTCNSLAPSTPLSIASGGTGGSTSTGSGSVVLSVSPALTGAPTVPTAASGTATTQVATTAFVDALRDVPSNAKAANYTLALADRGGGVDFNGTSLTCTIPANASVAFPIGSTIVITNLNASNLSIAITTDTLTMSGTTTTGTRTLGQNGEARIRKVGATSWLIGGTALS